MSLLKIAAVLILLLMLLAGGLGWLGARQWRSATALLEARLNAACQAPAQPRHREADLEGLPAPVQRYLRLVLRDGMPVLTGLALEQRGRFNLSEGGELWRPFEARQQVRMRRPGLLWDARIRLLPGLNVHVHDAYAGGQGRLHAALFGSLTLAELDERSAGDTLAEGELMRFLAEAPWYPTALLPSQGVQWSPVDAGTARASLADGGHLVSLLFGFGADGLVEWVRAEARSRSVGGRMQPTRWEGRWFDYREREGLLLPMRGEAAWLLDEGRKPYWRGEIVTMRHEFAAPPER